MLLQLLLIAAGLALLSWGANLFVNGSGRLAIRLDIPPLLVGVVLIGFATSAPEMITGVLAALEGRTSIAVGNALGSNIANLSLVLGIAALVLPLSVVSTAVRREYAITVCAMLLALSVSWDGRISRVEGAALFSSLLLVLVASILLTRRVAPQDPLEQDIQQEYRGAIGLPKLLLLLVGGLLLLLVGARLLLSGAVEIARQAGLSDLVIGLTVIAVGTSLPELAAAVISALKRETALSIGAILGSNTFNMLGCIGLPCLLQPAGLERDALTRDFPVMIGLTLLAGLFLFVLGKQRVSRSEGGILLLCFAGYQGLLLWYAIGTGQAAA